MCVALPGAAIARIPHDSDASSDTVSLRHRDESIEVELKRSIGAWWCARLAAGFCERFGVPFAVSLILVCAAKLSLTPPSVRPPCVPVEKFLDLSNYPTGIARSLSALSAAINKVNLEHRTNKETMEMMSAASNERSIELTVLRGPGADTLGSTQAGGAQNFLGSSSVISSPGRPGVHTGPPPPRQQAHKEIRVNKTPTGLDIAIARGGSDELGRSTVVVQHVVPTGNIGRDGRIKEGDTLLSIDGHSLLNIPLEDAARLLAIAKGRSSVSP